MTAARARRAGTRGGFHGILAAMLNALDHVILAVHDLDAASADYSRLLGLEPSWRGEHAEAGTANVLYRLENTYVELLSPSADGALSQGLASWLDARGDGLLGLAFATTDIDACHAELSAKGLEPGRIESGHGRDLASGAVRRWRRATLPLARTRGVLLFPIEHDSPQEALPMAAASMDPGASVVGLDHAVVQTSDGDAAVALYGGGLGLRLALDRMFPDWGVRLMFFRVGGVTVEVASALAGADAGAALPGAVLPGADALQGSDRLYGLSYRVRNAEAARERLGAAGVDVSPLRTGRRPGTRVFSVRSHSCGVPTLMLEVETGAR